jgi:hypothetical protein
MRHLDQAPKITKIPPIVHPILTPNLSRIILHGVAMIGCMMGPSNPQNAITTDE